MKAVHIGHHFFGAGNFGDDLMLAGFLLAAGRHGPLRLTCCTPHPLQPLRERFPSVDWRPYTAEERKACICAADVWLGLGGSPFQCSISRWFVDHLAEEAALCRQADKSMYFLGVGEQDPAALDVPELIAVVRQTAAAWTRDENTASSLHARFPDTRICAAADLAHLALSAHRPPAARRGRLALCLNFDFADWPKFGDLVAGLRRIPATERFWLAHESRDLPGAERRLWLSLPDEERTRWHYWLVEASPERGTEAVRRALAGWPSPERLVTSRYHAFLAGAWAGANPVVLRTNAKLAGAVEEFGCAAVDLTAPAEAIVQALESAVPISSGRLIAARQAADDACDAFFRTAFGG